MIALIRPNAALIRKVHELLGAGDFARPPCIGRALPFPDTRWHTVRSDAPVVQQASGRFRVLRPGGQIAVSDSDYNILTMAISSADPAHLLSAVDRRPDAGRKTTRRAIGAYILRSSL